MTGAFRKSKDSHIDAMQNLIKREVIDYENRTSCEKQGYDAMLGQIFKKNYELIAEDEYSCDERNTDNAWVETTVYNYHDKTGEQAVMLVKQSPGLITPCHQVGCWARSPCVQAARQHGRPCTAISSYSQATRTSLSEWLRTEEQLGDEHNDEMHKQVSTTPEPLSRSLPHATAAARTPRPEPLALHPG